MQPVAITTDAVTTAAAPASETSATADEMAATLNQKVDALVKCVTLLPVLWWILVHLCGDHLECVALMGMNL